MEIVSVLLPNWINSCGLLSEILEVLEISLP